MWSPRSSRRSCRSTVASTPTASSPSDPAERSGHCPTRIGARSERATSQERPLNGSDSLAGLRPEYGEERNAREDNGRLTTRQGHPVSNKQSTRTVGSRGPATLENYQFIEKIAHFDRERVPERGSPEWASRSFVCPRLRRRARRELGQHGSRGAGSARQGRDMRLPTAAPRPASDGSGSSPRTAPTPARSPRRAPPPPRTAPMPVAGRTRWLD